MQFLRNLFDGNERDVQKYRKVVDKINALEPKMEALSDVELRAKTDEFRERIRKVLDAECEKRDVEWDDLSKDEKRVVCDLALDPMVPETFAVAREAARRVLKMRPFDVQLIGGMVLHDGRIAEMKTGEGKTLTATLPIYLNALTGHGVHLVTVNDYLSKVGAVAMGPLYHFLGLSVGIIQGQGQETGDIGGTYIYDPEFRHPDPRYDFARRTEVRREAYRCDITYGTNNEYGFDYLRDNLAQPGQDLNQPELTFAIVDEVDSILIDEARTPLIISGAQEVSSDLYVKMDRIIRQLQEEKDYTIEEKHKTAMFTDDGQRRVELALGIRNLSDPESASLMQHASASLKAHAVYKKDIDYLVKVNEAGKAEVVIIDEFTGRLMFGRRWGDGLHQAVEAKEGVKIDDERRTIATITYQNLFRLYPKLAGMTGTAKTEEDEFRKIYALDVVQVPTNKPMIRKDHPDMIFKTEEAKLRGIAREILTAYSRQQPALVGTRSVEMSERVSDRLRYDRLEVLALTDLLRDTLESTKGLDKGTYNEYSSILNQKLTGMRTSNLTEMARSFNMSPSMRDSGNVEKLAKLLNIPLENRRFIEEALSHGIPHNILNAKSHEKEAKIISEAGRLGIVTIATNMAGRGVDILLGGSIVNDENEEEEGAEGEQYEYRRGGNPIVGLTPVGERGSAEHQAEADAVRALGGLYVVGCERHESRRIDNQLRGRAGRQGDPGASRFFVSMEDELMRLFGDKSNSPLLASWSEEQWIDSPMLSKMIERAQKKVELHYFDVRKHTLDYDDVMNVQREKIYGERRRILLGADLRATIVDYLLQSVAADVNMYASPSVPSHEWDLHALWVGLNETMPFATYASEEDLEGKNHAQLAEFAEEIALKSYEDKEQLFLSVIGENGIAEMRTFERNMTLRFLDKGWMDHLSNMEYLREGIGWRGTAGIDPLVLYKKEAYDEFQRLIEAVQDEIVRFMSFVQINSGPPQQQARPQQRPAPRQPVRMHPLLSQAPKAPAESAAELDGDEEDDDDSSVPAAAGVGAGISRAERRRLMKGKGRGKR